MTKKTEKELRKELKEIEARGVALTDRLRELLAKTQTGKSKGTYDRAIRDALTAGNVEEANELQQERAAAKAEIEDLREAIEELRRLAGIRQEAVATASLPRLKDEVEELVSEFQGEADRISHLAKKVMAAVNEYKRNARRSDAYRSEYGRVSNWPRDLDFPMGAALTVLNALTA